MIGFSFSEQEACLNSIFFDCWVPCKKPCRAGGWGHHSEGQSDRGTLGEEHLGQSWGLATGGIPSDTSVRLEGTLSQMTVSRTSAHKAQLPLQANQNAF